MSMELISYDFPVASISKCNVSFHGVPRRYEETKPVKIQNFTHQRIIGIGNQLHLRSLECFEEEKQQRIERAESLVWREAQKLQEEKIKRVREEAKKELDQVVQQLTKDYEQKIKEETLKVEMAMQKLSIEQIKEERSKGEKHLRIAVKQIEEKCNRQVQLAVGSARDEEKKIARTALNRLKRKHTAEKKELKLEWEKEKQTALEELASQKDMEIQEAVQDAINEEIKKANEQMNELKSEHEKDFSNIQESITSKLKVIEKLKQEIIQVLNSKAKLQQSLVETREEFQNFIHKMKYFDEGQSDYLLPSLDLQQFEDERPTS